MKELVFFLEEPSAREMLIGLLPHVLPDSITARYVVFEGKQDLEKQLVRRIQWYLNPDARFIVLRDQDSGDCRIIKTSLLSKCLEAQKPAVLVRIACHEIESWYLADLEAVEKGLNCTGLSKRQKKVAYREPDNHISPSRILSKLVPTYQKIAGSRAIGPYLNPENNRSRSFSVFVAGVRRIAGE